MSDPAKNVEIEDVLSSIRRLVSEEGRAAARPEVPSSAPKPGKLVLTPALRVAETVEPTENATLSEPETTVDRADHAPWTDPEATLYSAATAAGQMPAEAGTAEEPETDEEAAPDALAPETLAENADPEMEARGSEGGSVFELPDAEVADHHLETVFQEADAFSVAEQDSGEDVLTEESLTARIEVLETMISQAEEDWEPDGLSADAYSGTSVEAMTWQDHAPQDEDFAPGVHATADPEGDVVEDSSILSPDEAFLDEDSLRELVADIVREELQGALGERITRNVRKLVRREIHRALTAQELD
ncbi:hypothetical protein KBY23_11070 [Ruegeria pomeroyi]|nr:hypothetical protein [Ruegeria pomeroyi]